MKYRYTVYERATDIPVIFDGTASECARKMDVSLATFYSYVSKQKRDPNFGKFEIVVDEETTVAKPTAPVICDICETVFLGGPHAFVCPECRRKALRESAVAKNLSKLGNEAYLKQLSMRKNICTHTALPSLRKTYGGRE